MSVKIIRISPFWGAAKVNSTALSHNAGGQLGRRITGVVNTRLTLDMCLSLDEDRLRLYNMRFGFATVCVTEGRNITAWWVWAIDWRHVC